MVWIVRTLVVFGFLCGVTLGFFDIFRSSSNTAAELTPEELADPHSIRGLTDSLISRYENEQYECDNGKRVINRTAINDGYCDCDDQSDEPGTNACNLGTFHCRNKGYKIIKIPSSRVDDQVCDCCDGSDEIKGFCPNTCRKAAERERSELERIHHAYRSGSVQRKQMVSSVQQQLETQRAQLPHIENEINSINTAIDHIKDQTKAQEESLLQRHQGQLQNVEHSLDDVLKLQLDLPYLSNYLANLAEALDMTMEHITEQMTVPPPVSAATSGEDGYGEDPIGESEQRCEIVEITNADILQPLCSASNNPMEEIKHVIHSILQSYRPYSELLLLLGYHSLHQTFQGSAEFIKNHLASSVSDTCPVEFESIGDICSLKDRLRALIEQMNSTNEIFKQDPDLQRLKLELHEREEAIKQLQKKKDDAEKASQALTELKDHLAFFALKDQCFEVIDGKFSYSLCMLKRVTQKEEEGNQNTVTLGEYSSIEESDEHGHSYKMHFKNGQHCHAFGARSATATVICGEKNVLRSAMEPFTCFYTFVLESPAACTEKYAQVNGLQV